MRAEGRIAGPKGWTKELGGMLAFREAGRVFRPGLSFVLLLVFFAVLWIAGGASRADVPGQTIVRVASATILVVLLLASERRPVGASAPALFFLLASLGLSLLQLIPLPPDLWQALPGREVFQEAAAASGEAQPWRPWAIVPGTAVNAAVSLIVPAAMIVLISTLKPGERALLPGVLLSLIAVSMLLGLLQLSGGRFDNPFVNDTPGQISSSFANRNHFALFLAFGCLLAPVWAFLSGRSPGWRAPVALGLVILFPIAILVSGSRAGMLLGGVALAMGLLLTRRDIVKALRRYPRWVAPALIAAIVVGIILLALIVALAGRALSIDRVLENAPEQDMRARALPIVLSMVAEYFPAGAGLGGFDPLFRMHEPFSLLKLTYFNHAHNDWLEIVLDTGLAGLLLLAAALFWWGWASVRVWRTDAERRNMLPKAGSAILFLVFVASVFDYPARTPMIMAIIVIGAIWLGEGSCKRPALPTSD